MSDLAERFAAAIDELEVPKVDLIDQVVEELTSPIDLDARRSGRSPGPNRLVAACAAVILITFAILALEPTRRAVADFLGIGAVRIEQGGPQPATVPPTRRPLTTVTRPTSAPAQSSRVIPDAPEVDTSTPSSGNAQSGNPAIWRNPIPSLGEPRVMDGTAARRRVYSWPDPAPGISLEVRVVDGPLEFKRLGPEPGSEFLQLAFDGGVGGAVVDVTALWIPSAHQRVIAEGEPTVTAGPTLLWEHDGIQYRLEAPIERDAAVALALEVSGGTDLLAVG